ncbi:type I restriction endonuclease [Haladaptatus sp. F3-133]|uniref:DNA helicase n=1 Tax=Halorutilus salinus TaxID=2487751 RepID=A0A9Q4GH36_9EURY|nr:type I restriction endonuclease [Halorutilus salinus]MCX2819784.1 type I restriction endonuclease [Halorutilus salinus]
MRPENVEIKERWKEFYRRYCKNEISKIAQNEKTSLVVNFGEVEKYDPDLADDLVLHPDGIRRAAEDALADFDIAAETSLEHARVRFSNIYPSTKIYELSSDDVNKMVSIEGIVRKSSDAEPKVLEAAFECQRCGNLTNVEQTGKEFTEPHQCRGCERQGPFRLLEDQSDFVDAQKLRVQDISSTEAIDVNIEGDITGSFVPGDRVNVTGVLRAVPDDGKTTFRVFLEGNNVERLGEEDETPPTEFDPEDIEEFVDDAISTVAHLESRNIQHQKELVTRENLVTPFLKALGWNVTNEDVIVEYNGDTDGYVDYQLMCDGTPFVCVEAKSLGTTIADDSNFDTSYDPNAAKQLRRYMRTTGSEYGVLTNGKKYVIYEDVSDDRPEEEILLSVTLGDLAQYTDRLARITPVESS